MIPRSPIIKRNYINGLQYYEYGLYNSYDNRFIQNLNNMNNNINVANNPEVRLFEAEFNNPNNSIPGIRRNLEFIISNMRVMLPSHL